MVTREPLEWHFKQLDHAVGLSFKSNFHFALVGHLIKGYRHPTPTTVSRTSRVLTMLLAIVAKPQKRDKFEVTPESIAYLTALVSVSEEVRSRCHVKHSLSRWISDSMSQEGFYTEMVNGNTNGATQNGTGSSSHMNSLNRRQKSWDLLDQNAIALARQHKQHTAHQVYSIDFFFLPIFFRICILLCGLKEFLRDRVTVQALEQYLCLFVIC